MLGDTNGLVNSLLGTGEGNGLLDLLGGHGLANVDAGGSAAGNGDHTGLNVDIGSSNSGGATGQGDALINVNAETGSTLGGSEGTLGSLLGSGDGASGLGSALNGQGLLDANVGSAHGSGDALINVNADPVTTLGGTDGTVDSLLGNGDGVGNLASLLNGQGLLDANVGSTQGGGDALINVDADPGPTLDGTDGTVGSLLGNGAGVRRSGPAGERQCGAERRQ